MNFVVVYAMYIFSVNIFSDILYTVALVTKTKINYCSLISLIEGYNINTLQHGGDLCYVLVPVESRFDIL